mgnify:CR=1 FL=1
MYMSAEFLGGAGLWALPRGSVPIAAALPPLVASLLLSYRMMEPYRRGDSSVAYGAGLFAAVSFGLAAFEIVRSM